MRLPVARAAALSLPLLLSFPVFATSTLTATQPWVREAPPTAHVMAGYMTLVNSEDAPVIVTAINSPDFAAAELHRTVVEDGVARMLPVKQLEIPANGRITFEPGGLHLMLFDPQHPLREGATVELVFHCGERVCITVAAPVIRSTGEADHSRLH